MNKVKLNNSIKQGVEEVKLEKLPATSYTIEDAMEGGNYGDVEYVASVKSYNQAVADLEALKSRLLNK